MRISASGGDDRRAGGAGATLTLTVTLTAGGLCFAAQEQPKRADRHEAYTRARVLKPRRFESERLRVWGVPVLSTRASTLILGRQGKPPGAGAGAGG